MIEVSVIIPCYNEEVRIGSLLSKLNTALPKSYEIIVDADGCQDQTVEVAKKYGSKVFSSDQRLGKGLSLLRAAEMAEGEIVVFMDADFKTPHLVPMVVEMFKKQGLDILIGKRHFLEDREPPLKRRIASLCFRKIRNLLFGDLPDTQSGFKVLKREVLLKLGKLTRTKGFAWDVDLIVNAKAKGMKVEETEVLDEYDEGSKIETFHAGTEILDGMFKIWFSNLWRSLAFLVFLYALGLSLAASINTPMPIGYDFYFHLDVAKIWASGNNGMFSDLVFRFNQFPYPPVFHWLLVPSVWLNCAYYWSRILQIIFFAGTLGLTMLFVSRHGGGAKPAVLTGLIMLCSNAFYDSALQARPQGLDMMLLPVALGAILSMRRKRFSLASIASIYNHGLAAISLYLFIGIAYLRKKVWRKAILLTALAVLPIIITSFYYSHGAFTKWSGHTDTNQERLIWTNPLSFISLYSAASLLGFIYLAKTILDPKFRSEFTVLLSIVIVGSSIMILFWADRWLQYMTVPLSCLAGYGFSRSKVLFIVAIQGVFVLFMLFAINYWWVTATQNWWYPH